MFLLYLKSGYYLSITCSPPRRTRYSFFENVDASLNVVLGHVLNGFYEGLYVPVRITNKISDGDMIQTT